MCLRLGNLLLLPGVQGCPGREGTPRILRGREGRRERERESESESESELSDSMAFLQVGDVIELAEGCFLTGVIAF